MRVGNDTFIPGAVGLAAGGVGFVALVMSTGDASLADFTSLV